MTTHETRRILVVDDNTAIHADFRKILRGPADASQALVDAKAAFFGATAQKQSEPEYEIDSASQGKEAHEMVQRALAEQRPYAMAFVDVRMPPGWDGVETIARLWEVDPDLQCVICTAYADYSWEQMISKVGRSDRLLILKKPFDPIEACQLASALTEKWCSVRRERARLEEVRTAEQEARAYAVSLVTVNRALEAARARAEAALQGKSECLVSLSQEIRTPLVAMLGYADLLRSDALDPAQRKDHAGMIYRQGESVLAVLSDLFDLACVESGKLTLSRCPMSAIDVVQEVLGGFAAAAREKSLELGLETSGPVPSTIECDPLRLRQIVHHLVDNAIKFTPSGSVRVVLDLDSSTPHEPRLRIAVVDTGVGIRLEVQGRLFEAFSSLDSQLIREHGGAGLGLVLSKRLAQLMGGDLSVESEPGKGSTFTFTVRAGDLSAARMIDLPRGPMPSARPRAADVGSALEGMRVLVVEDVPTTAKLFRHFLESSGAVVEVAEDGARGVDRALDAEKRGTPFDVVLMDIQLPVMDGFEATGVLRQGGYRRPIVAVTACSLQGDREKCLNAGCDAYASKPLGREALVRVCKEAGAVQWTR